MSAMTIGGVLVGLAAFVGLVRLALWLSDSWYDREVLRGVRADLRALVMRPPKDVGKELRVIEAAISRTLGEAPLDEASPGDSPVCGGRHG